MSSSNQRPANRGFRSGFRCAISHYRQFHWLSAPEPRCRGLTQEQINRAKADPDNPPNLEGVIDAGAGEPLVWAGKATSSKQI